MFTLFETKLFSLAHMVPLEGFVLVASIVEEIVAPIPSSALMFFAGSVAKLNNYSVWDLMVLSILGAIGKTIGAHVVYVIVDRTEDVLLGKWGKHLGVQHEDIEKLGTKLTGGIRDYIVLIGLRATPIIPSVILSVGGGLLKIPRKLFLISTFVGTIFRDGLYLVAGFFGIGILQHIIDRANKIEHYIEIGFGIIIVAGLGYYFRKKINSKKEQK